MKNHNRWSMLGLQFVFIIGLLALTSCQNGNLFGKRNSRGSSGDPAVLLADAGIALRERNFLNALGLYETVLAGDPDNAQALYGAAAAAVGSSGINLAKLLSNLSDQLSTVNNLKE